MDNSTPTPRLKLRDMPLPSQVAGDRIKAAKMTVALMDSAAFRSLLEPTLLAIDEERDRTGRRGPKTLFTSRELESVFLFGWLLGKPAAKDARLALIDDHKARAVLGFDRPRGGVRGRGTISEGLPSEPSLSRHRQRVGDQRRLDAYSKLVKSV